MLSTVYSLYNSVKLDFSLSFLTSSAKWSKKRNKSCVTRPAQIMSACGFHIGTAPFFFVTHVPAGRFFFFFFFFLFFGFFRTFLFGERESSLPPNIKDEMRWAVPQMRDVFICSLSFCDYLRFHVLTHSFIYSFTHTQQLFPRRAFTCII